MTDTLPTAISPTQLVEKALAARENAYAPYSHYQVGAAVLTADGSIVTGCNVENAAYPATICAERVAMAGAVALGKRELIALALATEDGGTPCGICRQVMAELGPEMVVYIGEASGQFRRTTVRSLLPDSFRGDSLIARR